MVRLRGGTNFNHRMRIITYISINDYNGNGKTQLSKGENDTIIAKCYWLTVKYKGPFNNEMKIIAEPNTTGKKRTLYIYCMVDNNAADIKVTQSK